MFEKSISSTEAHPKFFKVKEAKRDSSSMALALSLKVTCYPFLVTLCCHVKSKQKKKTKGRKGRKETCDETTTITSSLLKGLEQKRKKREKELSPTQHSLTAK